MARSQSPHVAPLLALFVAVADVAVLTLVLPRTETYAGIAAFAGLAVVGYVALTLGYRRVTRGRASPPQPRENGG